ncbi:MAG: cupin domain-containing protein [Pirellulales bacterium]
MDWTTLLGELTPEQFVRDYWHRFPFSMRGTAAELQPLGTWDTLGEILAQRQVDLMVVRSGERYAGSDPADLGEAKSLHEQGYTILVRHAERYYRPLHALAQSFQRTFASPVNVHMYITPAGAHGFSWHYDAEDVFIVQTSGAKEYQLRKNTVHPWPVVESIPQDMRFDREIMPLMRVELRAGDWLYVPCGYWHKAEAAAADEAAISLAIGVMSRSALDVYDLLRTELVDSLLWRQRLPVGGEALPLSDEETTARYREILAQLADDITRRLQSEQLLEACLKQFSAGSDPRRDEAAGGAEGQ